MGARVGEAVGVGVGEAVGVAEGCPEGVAVGLAVVVGEAVGVPGALGARYTDDPLHPTRSDVANASAPVTFKKRKQRSLPTT